MWQWRSSTTSSAAPATACNRWRLRNSAISRRPFASSCRLIGRCSPQASCAEGGGNTERYLRRHRIFPDFGAAAEGAQRPGSGRLRQLRGDLAGLCGELFRQGLYRVPDGDHRPALDHCLRRGRIAARARPDAAGASGGRFRGGADDGGRADHRVHGAVGRADRPPGHKVDTLDTARSHAPFYLSSYSPIPL